MKVVIEYMPLPPDRRLEDVGQEAKGWSFKTLEHDEMNFPRIIEATDANGRSCYYFAESAEGEAIRIEKAEFEP
jgi:hypothetical protein